MIIGIIIGIIISAVIGVVLFVPKLRKHEEINNKIIAENEKNQKELEELLSKKAILNDNIKDLTIRVKEENKLAEESAEAYAKAMHDKASASIESDIKELEKYYNTAKEDFNKEYLQMMDDLSKDMSNIIQAKQTQIDDLEGQRRKLSDSIAATIQARVREKEIKEQLDFYCLKLEPADAADIENLIKIKSRLNKPRILSMLIWQTYYQKPMTQLCNDVLGTKIVTGIYKITNQLTGQSYIGQARDVASRWKEHAKCGLDIDRPAGNKLYQSMIEDGLQNFSWELLEECTPIELNEKEKNYIEMYQSFEFGFNSNKGVSK